MKKSLKVDFLYIELCKFKENSVGFNKIPCQQEAEDC